MADDDDDRRRRGENFTPLTGHGMWTILTDMADLTKNQRLSHEFMSASFVRGWAALVPGPSTG